MAPRDDNERNLSGRDYRKAFGQFASNKTQRITTLKPVEVLFDAQAAPVDRLLRVNNIDVPKADLMAVIAQMVEPTIPSEPRCPRFAPDWGIRATSK